MVGTMMANFVVGWRVVLGRKPICRGNLFKVFGFPGLEDWYDPTILPDVIAMINVVIDLRKVAVEIYKFVIEAHSVGLFFILKSESLTWLANTLTPASVLKLDSQLHAVMMTTSCSFGDRCYYDCGLVLDGWIPNPLSWNLECLMCGFLLESSAMKAFLFNEDARLVILLNYFTVHIDNLINFNVLYVLIEIFWS